MNNELNLPPFYVGQKVVALNTSLSWNKGDVFTVLGLRKPCCHWQVNIGVGVGPKGEWDSVSCEDCGYTEQLNGNTNVWANCRNFAPVQENFQSISLEKVLEKETPLISVN